MVKRKKELEHKNKDLFRRMTILRKAFRNNITVSCLVTEKDIVIFKAELIKPDELYVESDIEHAKSDDFNYVG